jgi:serine/threonine protein kinase
MLENDTKQIYAAKTVLRNDKMNDALLRTELETLLATDSPYTIKFKEVFYDTRYIHIVTEFVDGGDLHSRLKKGKCTE